MRKILLIFTFILFSNVAYAGPYDKINESGFINKEVRLIKNFEIKDPKNKIILIYNHGQDENDIVKYFKSNTFLTQRLIKLVHPLLKKQKDSIAVFISDNTKKANKKFLGVHNAIQAANKEIVMSYSEETLRIGPKVLLFEPLPMPTKTRNTVSYTHLTLPTTTLV